MPILLTMMTKMPRKKLCLSFSVSGEIRRFKEAVRTNELGKEIHIYNPYPSRNKPKEMIDYELEKTLHVVLTQWGYKTALVG